MNIDIWSLFITLLIIALLQEFMIKPSVELIKKYYHQSRKRVETLIDNGKLKVK
jgi:hypothetical protein